MSLTCKGEAPEVANVDQPHEQGQARDLPGLEEHAVANELDLDLFPQRKRTLLVAGTDQFGWALCGIVVGSQRLEILNRDAAFALVDSCNVLKHLNGLLILAAVDEEFGGFFEPEDHESHEEDEECDGPEGEHQVAPTHIVFSAATRLAGLNQVARLQRESSIVVCYREVRVA